MTDSTVSFTPEQNAQQNQRNLIAFILTSMAYEQAHGTSAEEYIRFIGQKFAPGWEQFKAQPMVEIGRAAAHNFVAAGATLGHFTADENRVEFVLAGWPAEEDLTAFEVTHAMVAPFYNIYAPIAEHIGLHYEWRQDGDKITMTFTRSYP